MGHFHRRFLTAVFLSSFLSGCSSDPKAANEANFTRAIDAMLEKPGAAAVCLQGVPQIPFEVSEQSKYSGYQTTESSYEPFIRAGLVEAKAVNRTQPATAFSAAQVYRVVEFSLSTLGRKGATLQSGFFGQQAAAFCYASMRVRKIVNFTEPGDVMGIHVTQVRWLPRLVNVADWTKDPRVVAALPQIATTLTSLETTERNSTLDLTNNGWEASR